MTLNDLREQAYAKLAGYVCPYLEQDLVSAQAIEALEQVGTTLKLKVKLGFAAEQFKVQLQQALQQLLTSIPGIEKLELEITWQITSHAVQAGVTALPGVKNVIAVASGKGGVGKSTTAVNLALALLAEGARVGILDADIYGPSQGLLLNVQQAPESKDGKTLEPVMSYGLQTMSIAYLVEPDTAMIWRGPMVSGALQQLLQDTCWHQLDYLIIDLPPGTGDIQLTLAQKIPVSGAVIVTTPQDLALLDVRRAIAMFAKVNIPVLGLIENMSFHRCSHCGHQEAIFGSGGGAKMAADYQLALLAALPLDKAIGDAAESGKPIVLSEPDSELAQLYRQAALNLVAKLSLRPKSVRSKFPKIVVKPK